MRCRRIRDHWMSTEPIEHFLPECFLWPILYYDVDKTADTIKESYWDQGHIEIIGSATLQWHCRCLHFGEGSARTCCTTHRLWTAEMQDNWVTSERRVPAEHDSSVLEDVQQVPYWRFLLLPIDEPPEVPYEGEGGTAAHEINRHG